MHIYQPFITYLCDNLAGTAEDPQHDFAISAGIAAQAQTILFSADQALALRPALEKFAEAVDYRLPFENVILQFDRPIPEREFFAIERDEQTDAVLLAKMARLWDEAGVPLHGWQPADGDGVVALLLTQGELDGVLHNQAVAVFASTALNRVHWQGTDVTWMPLRETVFVENKLTLRNLAVACMTYLNCINFTLELHTAPEKVQKRRARDGKPPLLAYYTVAVAPAYRDKAGEEGGGGWKHGHLYDVRGHFRRLSDGRLIWVRPHQRGLGNALYVPSVRKVG